MKTIAFALLLACSCSCVQAAENLKFHGTLIAAPTCTIDNDQPIEVSFGNVLIDTINGENFSQPVPYTIACDPDVRDDSLAMTLTLSGTAVDFDTAAIATDVTGLGIELRQNDTPFVIGSTIAINESSKPTLTAVPVKKAGAVLQEGAFEAWATLRVDYR